jgi:hypothetical protein
MWDSKHLAVQRCSSRAGQLLDQHREVSMQQLVPQAQQLHLVLLRLQQLVVVVMASAALWLHCAEGFALMVTLRSRMLRWRFN